MTAQDMREWAQWLQNCTPRQVQGTYDRECAAGRTEVAEFVKQWATAKGIDIEPYQEEEED